MPKDYRPCDISERLAKLSSQLHQTTANTSQPQISNVTSPSLNTQFQDPASRRVSFREGITVTPKTVTPTNGQKIKPIIGSSQSVPDFSKVPLNKLKMHASDSNMYIDDDRGSSSHLETFEPIVVNLDQIEEQRVHKLR